MKISELEEELKKIRLEHGDIDVRVQSLQSSVKKGDPKLSVRRSLSPATGLLGEKFLLLNS